MRYVREFYYGVSRILVVILIGVLGIVDRVLGIVDRVLRIVVGVNGDFCYITYWTRISFNIT